MKLQILTDEEITNAILAEYPGTIPEMDIDYDAHKLTAQAQLSKFKKHIEGSREEIVRLILKNSDRVRGKRDSCFYTADQIIKLVLGKKNE